MKVGILGGSFNPGHWGHFLVAQQSLDFGRLDEVWLMPCFSHPWQKNLLAVEHRLAMTEFLVNKKIKLCDLEAKKMKVSYTIETVRDLKKRFRHKFFWIVGSDLLVDFHKWRDYKNLQKETGFLVFPRLGFEGRNLPEGFQLIRGDGLIRTDISSEKIRWRIKNGFSIKGLAPKEVEDYIQTHKLYQF